MRNIKYDIKQRVKDIFLHIIITYNYLMLQFVNKFYEKHNLRPFMTTWLAYVHGLALIALVYSFVNYSAFLKVFSFLLIDFYCSCSFSYSICNRHHRWFPSALGS